MSDLIQSLLRAVETRDIDLGECSELYNGIKLPIRVNWTRAQKKRRWELISELYAIREELGDSPDSIDDLSKRADQNAADWTEWWAGVFLMTSDEVTQLRDTLPDVHWEWLLEKALATSREYEDAETKKVVGLRGVGSGEPAPNHQASGNESQSQDTSTQSADVPFSTSTTSS